MNSPNKSFCFALAVFSLLPHLMAQNPAGLLPASQPYVWRNVVIGGGGFVDGIVFHPTAKNLMYARTDVGGAYRWDDGKQEWVALLDWLSPAQNNFTGIESIALDPSDPNRLYLAAGTYQNNPAAILCSDDQGRTFKIAEVPFRMGGNAEGRSNGERLAVDPNEGAILFFGSRSDGLWKSSDHGATWARVETFTNTGSVQSTEAANNFAAGGRRGGFFFGGNQSVGIVSVVFDAASGHPRRADAGHLRGGFRFRHKCFPQRRCRCHLAGRRQPACRLAAQPSHPIVRWTPLPDLRKWPRPEQHHRRCSLEIQSHGRLVEKHLAGKTGCRPAPRLGLRRGGG